MSKQPSQAVREKAFHDTAESVRKHWEQQGKQSTDREVRQFTERVAELGDRQYGRKR